MVHCSCLLALCLLPSSAQLGDLRLLLGKAPGGSVSPSDSCSARPTRPLLRLEWNRRRLPHQGCDLREVPEGRQPRTLQPTAPSAAPARTPLVCLAPGSRAPQGAGGPSCSAQPPGLAVCTAACFAGAVRPCDTPALLGASVASVPTGSVSRAASPQGPEQQARGGWEVRREIPLPDFSVPSPLEPSQEGRKAGSGKQGASTWCLGSPARSQSGHMSLFLWKRHWSCLLSCRPEYASHSQHACAPCLSPAPRNPRTAHQTPPFRLLQPQPPEGLSTIAGRKPPAREVRLHLLSGLQLLWAFLGGSGFRLQVPLSLGCRPKPPGSMAPPTPGSQSCWLPPGLRGVGPQ